MTLCRAAIAAFVSGASIGGGAVWAFDNDTIHACVNPAGMPRIVDGPTDCKNTETPLIWNTTVAESPTSGQGPAGPQGDSSFLRIYRQQHNATAGVASSATAQAFCEPGDVVTGGGFFSVNPASAVEHSVPLNSYGVPAAWSVAVRVESGVNADSFTAYALRRHDSLMDHSTIPRPHISAHMRYPQASRWSGRSLLTWIGPQAVCYR